MDRDAHRGGGAGIRATQRLSDGRHSTGTVTEGDGLLTPASEQEYSAHRSGMLPETERVIDGVWTIPLPIPPGHMPYTLSYLIEDARGGIHLVDPGFDTDDNLITLDRVLDRLGRAWNDVASVIVTHLHPDHIGLAGRIRTTHGVPVVLHAIEQDAQERLRALRSDPAHAVQELRGWGVPDERFEEVLAFAGRPPAPVVPGDILVEQGDLLDIPGRRIRVLHTPGHTAGHICLHDTDHDLLYTGDHLLPAVVPGIGLGGPVEYNPLERYLDEMLTIADFDDCLALPGHGYRFRGVRARAQELTLQHLRRTAEVSRIIAEVGDSRSTWEVASQLSWSRGWANLTRQYLMGALRQTEMHVRLVSEGAHAAHLQRWGWDAGGNRLAP